MLSNVFACWNFRQPFSQFRKWDVKAARNMPSFMLAACAYIEQVDFSGVHCFDFMPVYLLKQAF